MVSRRALLRALGCSVTAGVAGCNALNDREVTESTPDETSTTITPTATLTPSPTSTPTAVTAAPTPTDTPPPTRTATDTPTATPTDTVSSSILTVDPEDGVEEFGLGVGLSDEVAIIATAGHGIYVFDADEEWTNQGLLWPDESRDFGTSAAVVGERAVIGGPGVGPKGAIDLFQRNEDTWWAHRHRFELDEERSGSAFGQSVAFDGDRVVVGNARYLGSHTPSDSRGAYIFADEGTSWTREAILGTDAEDILGMSVAIDGDTLLVGAPGARVNDESDGAAYVYTLADGEWSRQAVLSSPDSHRFGDSVALNGDTALVGSSIFERDGDDWVEVVDLFDSDESPNMNNHSVALTDDLAVVGVPENTEAGRTYVFQVREWDESRTLLPTGPYYVDSFGQSVALSGNTVLVGAPNDLDRAPTYVFEV